MSAVGAHIVTAMFEDALCKYTGAKYAVAVDNASNGLSLCLLHEDVRGKEIGIPSRTYMSVPCEVILAGGIIRWMPVEGKTLRGEYCLTPTRIWDSALRFTHNMYIKGQMQVVSFTGPYKHLKLGKGGAILLDDESAYRWLKKARNSGRDECSYHVDNFTQLGKNCYMMPQIAAQGLLLMSQFYELDGTPKDMPDLELPYPDLSKFAIYQQKFDYLHK